MAAPAWPGEVVEGGWGDDKLHSKHGHVICGFQGNDTIYAKNGVPDEIRGGPGKDVAYVDAGKDGDTVTGIETCKPRCPPPPVPTYPRRGHTSRVDTLRAAAQDITYPAYEGRVECTMTEAGERAIWLMLEPEMRAVDATDRPDWQTVAWKPTLYKLDGSASSLYGNGFWRWDRTYDEQISSFPGNFWRSFTSKPQERNRRVSGRFVVTEPGEYVMWITYHWYATPFLKEYEFEAPVNKHYGDIVNGVELENGTHEWCVFPS